MSEVSGSVRSAVLVVDFQQGVVRGAFDAPGVLARTQSLVERARHEQTPVIWVQHEEDEMPRDSADWQLADPLRPRPDEVRIYKTYRDAFADTPLRETLHRLQVGRLVVVGSQSDFCVRTAASRAAADGFDVVLVSDCHTTTDCTYDGITVRGEQVVAQTNAYFAGLRYPGQTFAVLPHDQVPLR